MRPVVISILLFALFTGGCKILIPEKSGISEWKEYKLIKNAKRISCSDVEICMSDKEMEGWLSDSMGTGGIRRRQFAEMFNIIYEGKLNGITYDCLTSLLGPPGDSSISIGTEMIYYYTISQKHDSVIRIYFIYNGYFGIVTHSSISISLEEIPMEISNCPEDFFAFADSILITTYVRWQLRWNYPFPMDESGRFTRVLSDSLFYERYDVKIYGSQYRNRRRNAKSHARQKLPGGCILCYLGKPAEFQFDFHTIIGDQKSRDYLSLYYGSFNPSFGGQIITLSCEDMTVVDIMEITRPIP